MPLSESSTHAEHTARAAAIFDDGEAEPVPFTPQVDLFRAVELLITGTTYLYHLSELLAAPTRSWGEVALWTVAMGAFFLWTQLDWLLVARGWGGLHITIGLALAAWALWVAQIGFIPTFLFYIVAAGAFAFGVRPGIVTALVSALIVAGEMFLLVGPHQPSQYATLLPWAAGLVFIGGTTRLTIREQEARARSEHLLLELQAAHQQLQQFADQAGQLAATQERNRIAREIHDSLGHYLTIINVQLESALALRTRDADRADRAVSEAKRLASEALADVRRSVAALHPAALDDVSLGAALERQIADFQAHSGVPATLALTGDAMRCSQAASLAIYRAVQEGLTNIRKHADATQVTVTVRFGPATTELTIADNGRGLPVDALAAPRPDDSGFGLVGLRERLALLGGTFTISPGSSGGTMLHAVIPNDSKAAR